MGPKRWSLRDMMLSCDPILVLAPLVNFGSYFAYDNPAALRPLFSAPGQAWFTASSTHPDGGDATLFEHRMGLLYTVYSLPNILIPFFVGALVGRLGAARLLLATAVCVALGQALVALGVQSHSFWTMLAGRFVFGLGGEAIYVALSPVLVYIYARRDARVSRLAGVYVLAATERSVHALPLPSEAAIEEVVSVIGPSASTDSLCPISEDGRSCTPLGCLPGSKSSARIEDEMHELIVPTADTSHAAPFIVAPALVDISVMEEEDGAKDVSLAQDDAPTCVQEPNTDDRTVTFASVDRVYASYKDKAAAVDFTTPSRMSAESVDQCLPACSAASKADSPRPEDPDTAAECAPFRFKTGLALTLAINICVGRVGQILNNVISPRLARRIGVAAPFWLGTVSCAMGCGAALAIGIMYRELLRRSDAQHCASPEEDVADEHGVETEGGIADKSPGLSTAYGRKGVLAAPFVALFAACFFYYSCLGPYWNVAVDHIAQRYFSDAGDIGASTQRANDVLGVQNILSCMLIPLMGVYISERNTRGAASRVLLVGNTATLVAVWTLFYGPRAHWNAYAGTFLLAVSDSSSLAFWSAVPFLVAPVRQALAYGLLTVASNVSFVATNTLVAEILSGGQSFARAGVLFLAMAVCTCMCIIVGYCWAWRSRRSY